MRKLTNFLLVIIFLSIGSCNKDSLISPQGEISQVGELNSAKSTNSKKSADVFVISALPSVEVVGNATLHRNKNGITLNFKVNGLTPGNAYTIWWVIFNNPENCIDGCNDADLFVPNVEADVLFATGHVTGGSGVGNFSAHLKEGDVSGSIAALFSLPAAQGLINAKNAEVHVILRDHGPAIPGIIDEQIHSYLGGCDMYACEDELAAVFQP